MLDASSLLIHPWQNGSTALPGWSRAVLDGTTATPLGRVRWSGPPRGAWFAGLRGHRLELLETEDGALLMTLIRPWGLWRLWELWDAEDRRVGTIYPPILLDGDGGRRGYMDAEDRMHGKILNPTAHVLAEFERRNDQVTVLRFAADLGPNPFLRMLLLGGVIVQEPQPGG
jgi:hypothetical protein